MQYSVISYIHPPKPVLQCMYSIISWNLFILYSMYCTPAFFFKFFILPELYTCFLCFSLQCLSTQYSYFCFNILSVLYSVGTPVFSVLLYYCTVCTVYSIFLFLLQYPVCPCTWLSWSLPPPILFLMHSWCLLGYSRVLSASLTHSLICKYAKNKEYKSYMDHCYVQCCSED